MVNNTITSYNDLSDLPTIPSKTSDLNNDSNFVSSDDLSEVAFTGSYNSLSDTPIIPDSTSELTNDGEDGEHPFITNQTDNLVNYYDKEFLFSILPKASGTGTSITLNNTIEAKMKSKLSPSEMEQEGTPTPDNPQDIHTTTGNNSIVIKGKNRLNNLYAYSSGYEKTDNGIKYVINSNGSITISGSATAQSSFNAFNTGFNSTTIVEPLDSSKYYNLSSLNSLPSGVSIYVRAYDGSNLESKLTSSNISFTSKTGITAFYIQVNNGTAISGNLTIYPQLIEGNTAPTSYQPYVSTTYPLTLGTLEYSKIGNYEDEFMIPSGSNKLAYPNDFSIIDNGITFTNTNGIYTMKGTSGANSSATTGNIPVENYTIESGDYLQMHNNTSNPSATFNLVFTDNTQTAPATSPTNKIFDLSRHVGKTIKAICLWVASDKTLDMILSPTIVKSATVIGFEPYGTKWYLKKNIGKVVLDGSENWIYQIANTRFVLNYTGAVNGGDLYCNHYIKGDTATTNNTIQMSANYIYIKDTRYSDTDNFKTWLSSHNTIVDYCLATPTYTLLNDTLQTQLTNIYNNMMSKKGQTNLSQVNDDLPFNISAKALKDSSNL